MSQFRSRRDNGNARVFLVFFAVVAVTLFFAWTRLQNIRIRREIARLTRQEAAISLEINGLRLRYAQLTAPDRLESLGISRYGLKRPSPKQVLILREP